MRKKALSFGLLVLVILALFLVWQYQANARLRHQVEAAALLATDIPTLKAQNKSLLEHGPARELAETEAEAARLRAKIYAGEKKLASLALAEARRATEADRPPSENWKNPGRATPTAALETGLWAQGTGDVDELARCISFDREAQAEIEKMFSALTAETRQYYATPERMLAELTIQSTNRSASKGENGESYSLVEKSRSSDTAEVSIRQSVPERGLVKDVRSFVLKLGTDGWKVVVPVAEIKNLKDVVINSAHAIPPSQRALAGKR